MILYNKFKANFVPLMFSRRQMRFFEKPFASATHFPDWFNTSFVQ
jgi:hypothetical protein